MKGFISELPPPSEAPHSVAHPAGKQAKKKVRTMKYTLVLLTTLTISFVSLLASVSVDHLLIEKLFIACTIVFSTLALKAASIMNEPAKEAE